MENIYGCCEHLFQALNQDFVRAGEFSWNLGTY